MTTGDDPPAALSLAELDCARAELDRLDEAMLILLATRRRTVHELWRRKAEAGVPLRDPKRETALLNAAAMRAAELSLPEGAVRRWVLEMLAVMRDPAGSDGGSVGD